MLNRIRFSADEFIFIMIGASGWEMIFMNRERNTMSL